MNSAWQDRKTKEEYQQRCWERLNKSRDEMNFAHGQMQHEYEASQRIWAEYKSFRDYNNQKIENLKSTADHLAYNMRDAFERASNAYNYGDKSDAPSFAAEGKRYRSELEGINSQIRQLGQEVKDARYRTEQNAQTPNNSRFKRAQREFQDAKSVQENAKREYSEAKQRHESLKLQFDALKLELEQTKQQQKTRIEILRSRREDSKGWGKLIHGSLDGKPVTVKIGYGDNAGHTLIADGHISEKDFDGSRKHNHYGVRREADGEFFSKDRGFYTGPDH